MTPRLTGRLILVAFRLAGALNVGVGLPLRLIALTVSRARQRWAWWTLLTANAIAPGRPWTAPPHGLDHPAGNRPAGLAGPLQDEQPRRRSKMSAPADTGGRKVHGLGSGCRHPTSKQAFGHVLLKP